ncbi:MAG: site-specific integrase [Treponema sp.]|nr:site-specific integrase [Treponema sp.]
MKDFELLSRITGEKVSWYFTYKDGEKKRVKTCKGCKTESDALLFISNFKKRLLLDNQYLIKNIASDMFLSESEHLKRLKKFGKTLSADTIQQKRQFIELIIKSFGNKKINELKISEIENYLLEDDIHSGSWKNFYLETFGNIYDETIWKCKTPVQKPKFQRFARNSRKPDVFTEQELNLIFNKNLWDSYKEWLLFYVTSACGLRLGEARALQVRQIKIREGVLIVDGFLKRNGIRTNYNKKGNENDQKIRCVPIPDKILIELINYINLKGLTSNDFLFLNDLEKTYTNCHLEHTFKKVLRLSGVNTAGKKFVPHSLRFTYVTKMRTAFSVEDVRKMVGHSSTEMTEYYTRMMISDMCQALQPARNVVNELFE